MSRIGYHAGILVAGLATVPSAHADEEMGDANVLAYASVRLNGTLGRFAVGMRTSDFLASEKYCLTKDGVGCSIEDEHRSTPKNIGNVLCLPYGRAHVVTERCLALLNAGREAGC